MPISIRGWDIRAGLIDIVVGEVKNANRFADNAGF